MKNRFIILMLLMVLAGRDAFGEEANLGFTFIAYEGEKSEKVTCDFCGYKYKESSVRVDTREVNGKENSIVIAFYNQDENWREKEEAMFQKPISKSDEKTIEIMFFQRVELKKLQELKEQT